MRTPDQIKEDQRVYDAVACTVCRRPAGERCYRIPAPGRNNWSQPNSMPHRERGVAARRAALDPETARQVDQVG